MGAGGDLRHGQFLSRDRACQPRAELAGCAQSSSARRGRAGSALALAAAVIQLVLAYQ
jgi:hypothetical protein